MRLFRPVFAFALALSACNGDVPPSAGAIALFDTSPMRGDFFALPWPSDARVKTDGNGRKHLDLTGLYNPGSAVGDYLQIFAADDLTGFGTSSAVFFRFDAPIDPGSLPPSAADSIAPGSTAMIVDVTPKSPTFGRRQPLRARFRHEHGDYIGDDWLALLPEPGFPLREKTTYAALLTDGIRTKNGGAPVRADSRFTMPAVSLPLDIDPAHVVVATVFTTGDFTHTMRELRESTYRYVPDPPLAADFEYAGAERNGAYDIYEGTYTAPNFQEGDTPYLRNGGRIHLGDDGKPQPVRMESLRFALTVPRAKMPPGGWPIVLYAHGTGGDYRSFIDDRSALAAANVRDDNGNTVSQMAMIGIDQVLHGPRDPTDNDPAITFYNFQNIPAARDNVKQGAADDFTLLRLIENMDVASAPSTGNPIKFDKNRIYFKGHSQGGTTGPLFLAFEPKVKVAILSGAGAALILALLNKTEPVDIPSVVRAIVNEDIDEYHPLLTLIQWYLESADPGNYARYFFREPPVNQMPKQIYQSMGVTDHYTPIPTIKALALAMGVQPATPTWEPIETLPLTPLTWAPPPLSRNVQNGTVTGVLGEYKVPVRSDGHPAYDGHFVVFNHPDAVRQSNRFLASHAATGTAVLVP